MIVFTLKMKRRFGEKSESIQRFNPPPDLAIEIDLTSRTQLANYRVLGVKEVWRFDGKELSISILQEGEYVQAETSDCFPNLPVIEVLPQYLEQSRIEGRNAIVKRFRAWVRERISL